LLQVEETDLRARFALRPFVTTLRGRTMASQAQIDANKRNSRRSTGPKACAKLNALKDGSHAKTVRRVLPQERAIDLDERINKWINEHNPRNDAERELVIEAAELAWTIDRTKRSETARMAERVRQAMLKADKQRYEEVGELGRRLLYNTEAKPLPTPGRRWEDNPAAFLKGLESSAEGCRWLLDHWIGLRVLLDRSSDWTCGDMFRLIRLLGKYPVEAINDPQLNAIFLAWDAIVPGSGERFWKECKKCKPLHDPGFSDFGRWREIAERPADAAAAVRFFERLMDEQVARLEELLEVHEEIAGDDPAELADCASFDGSAEGERLRRSLSAQRRELRQTLELLMKMQKTEDHGHAACDGGHAKAGETPETETLAPEVATAHEDDCEPGAAATPGPKKANRDKHRSLSALEMVRSGRLDEQGFEKFFADPPAALVVLKGLRKLAERKVLLGRAPVQASRSVTGESGMKNAEIEANGNEAQTTEPQQDKARNPMVVGEKRSQVREE
jgi:hypothetical protein